MKKRILCCILIVLSFCCRMTAASGVYDVRNYGAKGDGRTLDHVAINKAIEAATAAGGGQVVLSAGTYLCGSIRLKNNVELHLMAGAKILAAPASMKAYDESESFGGFPEYQDGGHTYFHNSLIWAEGQQNVSITGHGMIDGEGLTKRDTEKAGNVQGGSIGMGDKAIALKLCRNVSLSNIHIQYRGGGKKVTTPYREQGTNYPEPRWAGSTPAYGLFARHVDGLHLQNVKFELMRPDERPDIILEDVTEH